MNLQAAETMIGSMPSSSSHGKSKSPEETLQSFANLDHTRSARTGFPEVIFAQTKTPKQVAMILDDMARHVNDMVQQGTTDLSLPGSTAILATRVTPEMNDAISKFKLEHGAIIYHETARIISMKASALANIPAVGISSSSSSSILGSIKEHVVVATAGTTDLPVAEEAAVVLEAAGCKVVRIFDVGVAGLHRVINALPKLRDENVGAVIVCAGMDGALPSVVGGLVSVPVYAVPTSVGYGVSLGGIAAMLTMLNSCAPGVSVVNVDNGFGAAACAFKSLVKVPVSSS